MVVPTYGQSSCTCTCGSYTYIIHQSIVHQQLVVLLDVIHSIVLVLVLIRMVVVVVHVSWPAVQLIHRHVMFITTKLIAHMRWVNIESYR
jgi:hypothetical protein